jgi:hypothetical protein
MNVRRQPDHGRDEGRRDHVAESEQAISDGKSNQPAVDGTATRRRRRPFIAPTAGDQPDHGGQGEQRYAAAQQPVGTPAVAFRGQPRNHQSGYRDADTDAGEMHGGETGTARRRQAVENDRRAENHDEGAGRAADDAQGQKHGHGRGRAHGPGG